MSVEKLSRDRGTITHCSNGAFEGRPPCPEGYVTGLTAVRNHHASARKQGWGTSAVKGFGRLWLCPDHKASEKRTLDEEKAQRKRDRTAATIARRAAKRAERKAEAVRIREERKAANPLADTGAEAT